MNTKEQWKIKGEYIEGPDHSPRFRVMGTAPYNQEWMKVCAAAPEMLAALKDCVGFLKDMADDYSDYGVPETYEKVKTAIALAEGRKA